ncbi:uncharacterized protein LOC119010344 [Acanthopagrus latus]|uniref:uncharacterized protein LOC119010343 n=1 Tax=Acanthopagrus latus TaxID=8177 RepID=UPI00187C365D|nr:uncharacterized protein LOC119010343 [Acanthopagrus latus]XP_036938328.1 uncharacterized protein LOC119010344 [Acanthopagrus latus]
MQLTAQSFSLQTSGRLLKLKLLLSDSNMALGLFGRLSWICVLFSCGACFPATKGDYRYPYTATWGSAGGPAPGSNLHSGGSRAPEASSLSLGYVSPPVGTGKKTPSFSPQLQPVAGTSGGSNLGSVYGAPDSGFAYPAGNTATAYESGPSSGYNVAPLPYDNSGSPGLPWVGQPAGGADASFYDPSSWMPSRPFPDLTVWESGDQMSQGASETSPLPPSSYIVQSRNGYLRAREVLSHTNYSPEYPQPPVYVSKAVKAPSGSLPATGPKGKQG